VHYAVNCASLGCPDLLPRPLAAHDLDHALDMAAIAFVNHPRGVRVEADGALHVSSIYVWFKDDFGGDDAGVIRHLMAYADPDLAMRLQRVGEIGGDGYDWRLNDAGQNDR
jgi:hypothetical protein